MGQDCIQFILPVFIRCTDLAGLHLRHDLIDKGKPFAVGRFHSLLIRQIHIALHIGRGMLLSFLRRCRGNQFFQTFAGGGRSMDHGYTQLFRQSLSIDLCLLSFIDIRFIQSHNHGHTQFH